jgi:LysR family transcriptional activator of glutamate synthase operon
MEMLQVLSKTDEYFITIAKVGNLNQASKLLYVSQPSLSKYIQRLEERVGAKLFDHSTTPLKLNEAGELYLKFLLNTQTQEQEFLERINEIEHMERGTLNFGIPPYCGQCYMPQVLPNFVKRYPNIKINMIENSGDYLENCVLNQEANFAIIHHPVSNPLLTYKELLGERILLVAKKSSKSNAIQKAHIEYFKDTNFILPQDNQKIGKIVNQFLVQHSFSPKIFLRTRSVELIILLAAQGMGVGFIPESGLHSLTSDLQHKVSFFTIDDEELNKWKIISIARKDYKLRTFEAFFLDLFSKCSHT